MQNGESFKNVAHNTIDLRGKNLSSMNKVSMKANPEVSNQSATISKHAQKLTDSIQSTKIKSRALFNANAHGSKAISRNYYE